MTSEIRSMCVNIMPPDKDGRIILKCIWKKWDSSVWTEFICLTVGSVWLAIMKSVINLLVPYKKRYFLSSWGAVSLESICSLELVMPQERYRWTNLLGEDLEFGHMVSLLVFCKIVLSFTPCATKIKRSKFSKSQSGGDVGVQLTT
jgi:hypothetical protein